MGIQTEIRKLSCMRFEMIADIEDNLIVSIIINCNKGTRFKQRADDFIEEMTWKDFTYIYRPTHWDQQKMYESLQHLIKKHIKWNT